MKVTISDVANHANVSKATVSRVLNGNDKVDKTLAERVLASVKTLGYKPNRNARRLRKETHDVIGLIVSDIQNPHFVSIIKGAEEEAYTNDINILLCNSNEDSKRFTNYINVMQAESITGLIVVPTGDDDLGVLQMLRANGIAVVLLDRGVTNFEADVVSSDNKGGTYDGVKHLLEHGYRRVAFIQPNVHTGNERYAGYAQAHMELGISIDPALVIVGSHQVEDGYQSTLDLMRFDTPPDAIFTANNLLTIGALRALRELDLLIPDDVALMGFDDIPYAEHFTVSLTTVAQPIHQLGQEAVRTLLWRLKNPNEPYLNRKLATTLHLRESCGTKNN